MVMKQTQTKLFDFSDVGLDFCAGSKNLFPDRFKKMLSLGYNEQTVSSVAVAGNQVIFTYGGSHGYVADRVLKVDSGALSSINGGEFWIDSVTTNTVTFTLDSALSSVAGNFKTRIAPLGWSLEYEVSNIHVYKFRALDESDLFLRLCFQTNTFHRNAVAACIGKSYNAANGDITDLYAHTATKNVTDVNGNFLKWEYSLYSGSGYNNWTYNEGFNTFGKASLVGSKYHLINMIHLAANGSASSALINGFLPTHCYDYSQLKLPILFAYTSSSTGGDFGWNHQPLATFRPCIGNIVCKFLNESGISNMGALAPNAIDTYLPSHIESFNTTTAHPIHIHEQSTGQFLGCVLGIYRLNVGINNLLSPLYNQAPLSTYDIDVENICLIHNLGFGSTQESAAHFVAPVEEIKIVS